MLALWRSVLYNLLIYSKKSLALQSEFAVLHPIFPRMLHLMRGTIHQEWNKTYLSNSMFGLEVLYNGIDHEGLFFLFPYLDESNKTCRYFCFASNEQKQVFEKLIKISGIGPKTWFLISAIPTTTLHNAVEEFDTSVLESIQWIGKKTAKKILVELKDSLTDKDITKLNRDNKTYTNIVKSLTTMGYEKDKISKALQEYEGEIKKETLQKVLIWTINKLK